MAMTVIKVAGVRITTTCVTIACCKKPLKSFGASSPKLMKK
ncbi:MAG: hypothetical protein QM775_22425 [Pirellulales bacterium]